MLRFLQCEVLGSAFFEFLQASARLQTQQASDSGWLK